jgi:hypothetical protein
MRRADSITGGGISREFRVRLRKRGLKLRVTLLLSVASEIGGSWASLV